MNVNPDTAVKLYKFQINNPELAKLIIEVLVAERDKLRTSLESPVGAHTDYINAGRAQAFKEASEIFKDAAKAVENIQKRNT